VDLSYGYDRYISNQVDEMMPQGNLPPEKKAAIEAFEREKYGDVVRPGASGYGRFIEANASNASWVVTKEAMKYTCWRRLPKMIGARINRPQKLR